MKKLMIAACAVALAAGVQAATFSWQTDEKLYSIPAATISDGLAAGQTYNIGSSNADSVKNQIDGGQTFAYTMVLSYGDKTDTLTGTFTSGDFASRKVVMELSSDLIAKGDNPYDVDYSIILTGSISDGKGATWDVTSDEISGTYRVMTQGDLIMETGTVSTWSTESVPEPTSGLLLLLGVAGLALKRKRA